jgi:hypothetical protein
MRATNDLLRARSSKEALTVAANDTLTEQLPNKHDLARYFQVTVRTIERWTASRLLPSIKFGPRCTRYRWPEVQRAVNRLRVEEIR